MSAQPGRRTVASLFLMAVGQAAACASIAVRIRSARSQHQAIQTLISSSTGSKRYEPAA